MITDYCTCAEPHPFPTSRTFVDHPQIPSWRVEFECMACGGRMAQGLNVLDDSVTVRLEPEDGSR